MVNDTGRNIGCCGKNMSEVTPRAEDAHGEKHTPILDMTKGNRIRITVGPADNRHPMTEEHGVAWVCLVTNEGSHRKKLRPDGEAEAEFLLSEGERPIKAFAYCNLHGLWVSALS